MHTTTTTPQFGRRGAAPLPRDPPRPGARPPAAAASAFEAATRWNRPASTSEPSMSAIFAPLPDQDEWVPQSGLGPSTDVAPPPSDLAAKLFSFDGRIRRRDFWLMSFLCSGATLVAALICLFALPQPINVALVFCLGFVSAFVHLSLQVKRWHDRGRSGIWAFVLFVPFLGQFWTLLECGFMPGTPGPNRYGASPK
jgi:uncharacterized membrane protein YhaH (DUF805 family)